MAFSDFFQMNRFARLLALLAWLMAQRFAVASENHGVVQFGGLPVPGATVSATRGDQKVTVVTDPQGAYMFPDLADGMWTIDVTMPGFAAVHGDVNVAPGAAASAWELKMLPFAEVVKNVPAPAAATACSAVANPTAAAGANAAASPNTALPNAGPQNTKLQNKNRKAARAAAPQRPGRIPARRCERKRWRSGVGGGRRAIERGRSGEYERCRSLRRAASDGLLINGSANNGAASAFSQAAAFGNNRRGAGSLYNGSLGLIFDNSAFDARSYSLTGQDTPKAAYQQTKGVFTLGGPLSIPHLMPNGPMFFVGYQWTRNRNASTQSALVPTLAEREGDAGGGVAIPSAQINPQALALLSYYPLPNFNGSNIYNYQVPLVSDNHQDALQARLAKGIGQRTQLDGSFDFQRIATSSTNIFGFLDTGYTVGRNAGFNARRRIGSRLFLHSMFQYSYQAVRTTPYFSNLAECFGRSRDRGE